jgi:ribosome biogenesis GTPase / thiamine phosphate phosphatase
MEGKIIKIISNDYTVATHDKLYVCKSRGKFRNQKITPLVGDKVLFDEEKKYIMEILPRKNSLVRPSISNIDQAVIVMSVVEPDFSTNLLDKLLVIIEFNNIKPIICLTKLDLKNNLEKILDIKKYYESIGYEVYRNDDLEPFKKIFKDKITVFTGQSGSGKSTLLNKLDINLNLKTDEISIALGRGKHTTRHVHLITVLDGLIADTPGFSAITFDDMKKEDIRDNFIEFNLYRDKCRYSDCMHNNEEECFIKEMVKENKILTSRYQNYIKFISK